MENSPSFGLIMVSWEALGKEQLASKLASLSELGAPGSLGPEWPRFSTPEEARHFFALQNSWAALSPEGVLAGGFGLREDGDGSWFYYFLLPPFQGKGLSMELLALVQERAVLERPSTAWLGGACLASNLASIAALAKAGFSADAAPGDRLSFKKRLD
jgi:RimJ/RimL family protein N-acetyltransferase